MSFAKDCTSTVIPAVRYRDAHAAIDWLVQALGFEKKAVYDGPDNTVAHAELTFGNGMIMLGSASNQSPMATMLAQPDEAGMRVTATMYLVVRDAAGAYAKAKAAGAEMVQELELKSYGGGAFSCRDPEGHVWSLGQYDPWAT